MKIAPWHRHHSTDVQLSTHSFRATADRADDPTVAGEGKLDCGPADTLLPAGRTVVQFGDLEVLVVRTRQGVFAIENRCPHIKRRLSDAAVGGRALTCAGHGQRYDLSTGKRMGAPMAPTNRAQVFNASIEAGRLWIWPRPNTSEPESARTRFPRTREAAA
jgi:nitrite reductase/ring-hydroxylating ferredoxin subunit